MDELKKTEEMIRSNPPLQQYLDKNKGEYHTTNLDSLNRYVISERGVMRKCIQILVLLSLIESGKIK